MIHFQLIELTQNSDWLLPISQQTSFASLGFYYIISVLRKSAAGQAFFLTENVLNNFTIIQAIKDNGKQYIHGEKASMFFNWWFNLWYSQKSYHKIN